MIRACSFFMFFMKLHVFFSIDFCIDLFIDFWWKMAPKMDQHLVGGAPFLTPFFATFSEGRLFDAFWSPLGSLWAPFWLPLAPFWHPLAHFWRPLAPFWRHLAPFWHPLAHFWLTFGVFWLTFNISRSLFSYFYVLSMKMSCKIVFYFFFWKFLGTRFRNTPADKSKEPLYGRPFFFAPFPLPPGPERNPGCASFD